MKKKFAMLFAAILTAGLFSGCGATESTVLKDLKVEKYVTLGEYKGLEATVSGGSVDQEEWDNLVSQVYEGSITAEAGGIRDRMVEEGDTVNIDYVGKKEDVAFDGGTAQGTLLTIGSHSYIDGFEDGLIGAMPGETVDLNLTFPESYGNADLAGQAVVFTVTVNFIVPVGLQDEVVAAFGADEFSNVEELRQYVYEYLNSTAVSEYNSNAENAVLEAFMQSCIFKDMPKKMVDQYGNSIRTNVENAAASAGVDADTYTSYYYGTDLEGFVASYAEESVKQGVAFQAVANAEGLAISDEELNELLVEYAGNAGYDTVEDFTGENSLEDYREYFMFERVMEFLVNNAVITSG